MIISLTIIMQPYCLYTTYRCPPKIKSPVIYCLPLTVIHLNPDAGFKNSSNPLYFYQGSGALLACGLFWLKPDCRLQAVLVYIFDIPWHGATASNLVSSAWFLQNRWPEKTCYQWRYINDDKKNIVFVMNFLYYSTSIFLRNQAQHLISHHPT